MERKDYIAAIDLGSSNVAVVVGHLDDDGKLNIVAGTVRKAEGMSRGEIKNIELVASSLKEAIDEVQQNDIKIDEAFTGISGQHLECMGRSYNVPVEGADGEICQGDVQKLTDNMRNVKASEGKKILLFVPQYYTVNDEERTYRPVGMFGQNLGARFNFVIASNSAVDRLHKAFEKVDIRMAGAKPLINPIMSAEAVLLPDEKETGVAVVDIGGGTTDLCIWYDNVMRHVAVVPVGSDAINEDIKAYGIFHKYAEALKTSHGSAVAEMASPDKLINIKGRLAKDVSYRNLALVIEARMLDIVKYVMDEIARAGFGDKLPCGIVLTGGGAKLKNIDHLFRMHTGMEVRLAAPTVWVNEASMPKAYDPALSAAIGMLYTSATSGARSGASEFVTIPQMDPHEAGMVAGPENNAGREGRKWWSRGGGRQHKNDAPTAQDKTGRDAETKPEQAKGNPGTEVSQQVDPATGVSSKGVAKSIGNFVDKLFNFKPSPDDDNTII